MRAMLFALAWFLVPFTAAAQTPIVVSATSGIAFTASADHAITVGTTPKVVSYRLDLAATAAPATVVATLDLGKPTPDGTNTITVQPVPLLGTIAEGLYVARVYAVGPAEVAASVDSDPFVRVRAPAAPGKPGVKK